MKLDLYNGVCRNLFWRRFRAENTITIIPDVLRKGGTVQQEKIATLKDSLKKTIKIIFILLTP